MLFSHCNNIDFRVRVGVSVKQENIDFFSPYVLINMVQIKEKMCSTLQPQLLRGNFFERVAQRNVTLFPQ